jgi:hypothetical protein
MALCSTSRSSEQRLEAMKWYFGKRHCRTIVFDIDAQGESFDLNVIDYNYSEKKYLVFLDDGIASAPTPSAGVTLITVDTSAAVDGEDMADAFVLAMASIEVRLEQTVASVEVQNYFVGAITAESYASAPGMSMTVGAIGFGGYIGQTGESELSTTVEVVQLLDDAQGTVIQDEIITGYGAEITIPLREMSTQRWKDLVGSVTGNNLTIDTKDIVGIGTEKLYQSMFQYSGRLVGHPVRNEAINIDEDIVMLNTAPKMNSINFSGASIQEAEFLFTSYKDANADEKLNLLARGDHSKF